MNTDNRNWSVVGAGYAVIISVICLVAMSCTSPPRHTAQPAPTHAAVATSQRPSAALATVAPALPTPSPSAALRKRLRPSPASRSRHFYPTQETHGYPSDEQWAALRQCENGGAYTSRPGDYYRGAYQFDYSTWRDVGGSGDPADASPAEQDYRARLLYKARSWTPWPVCGRKYLR